jgi:hypothetical protein
LNAQIIVAFIFGVIFITALILLAIRFSSPTPFQYNVFRTVLSLAAAGVAAVVPGFIDLELSAATKLLIRAGGALAVFVMTFFFNPAQLAAYPQPRHDQPDFDALPEPPKRLRDGTPFTDDQQQAFFKVWERLLMLNRAGEDLWDRITDRTLSNFADRHREAQECIEAHALFFSEEDYRALEEMMQAANFFFGGKEHLSDIRMGRVISDSIRNLAPPGEKDRLVNSRIRRQIQQNKRWLTRYRNLLADIRKSFHTSAIAQQE